MEPTLLSQSRLFASIPLTHSYPNTLHTHRPHTHTPPFFLGAGIFFNTREVLGLASPVFLAGITGVTGVAGVTGKIGVAKLRLATTQRS